MDLAKTTPNGIDINIFFQYNLIILNNLETQFFENSVNRSQLFKNYSKKYFKILII